MKTELLKTLLVLLTIMLLCYKANTQAFLQNFSVSEKTGKVYLSWELLTGITCNGIKIAHSIDLINFDIVGEIPGICGSKFENVHYSFEHDKPLKNKINYYRLTMGGLGYSDTISIEVLDYKNGLHIRPNPANGNTKIYFENDGNLNTLDLYNFHGQFQLHLETMEDHFEVNAEDWPNGIHFFTLLSPGTGIIRTGHFIVNN